MTDHAANLSFFLLDQTGSVFGRWTGRMSAAEQRALFGRFLGKGTLIINGTNETVAMSVKVCFGLDSDVRTRLRWNEL
jgi:hypothetical protein